eukprot:scaffold25727_cov140-Isochrysis_galbana.AAC.2
MQLASCGGGGWRASRFYSVLRRTSSARFGRKVSIDLGMQKAKRGEEELEQAFDILDINEMCVCVSQRSEHYRCAA